MVAKVIAHFAAIISDPSLQYFKSVNELDSLIVIEPSSCCPRVHINMFVRIESRTVVIVGRFLHAFSDQDAKSECSGTLKDKNKPILFSMARLDQVKNISGLVEMFAKNPRLRQLVNLVVVAGNIQKEKSKDREEMAEIDKMHNLMKEYKLDGDFRWLCAQTDRVLNGELYRYIADTHGAFVQPALYEGFGLTVIEAMTCGLPTFATCHGGPKEIVENEKSGFHIDPYHGDAASTIMVDFFDKCTKEDDYWSNISDGGLERIHTKYVNISIHF